MFTAFSSSNVGALTGRWWALVARGVAAILFGLLAFVAPGASLLALVLLWGAYALVDGVFNLIVAARGARHGRSWGWLLFSGLVGVATGAFAFSWPDMTALALLTVVAVWAVFTGVAEIASAIRLRRIVTGEWLLAASGVLSIAFGALLLAAPGAGAVALAWMVGTYALVLGGLLVGLGVRLHRWAPLASGTPTPA